MTNQPSPSRTADWSWLADTYWYVPAESLTALRYDPKHHALTWVVDQTVWHITGYRAGYCWGVTSVLSYDVGTEPPARPTGLVMFGSITPEGSVLLTFSPERARLSVSSTVGTGHAILHDGGARLEMQMATGTTETLAHWAYMARTAPGEASWSSLPGVARSVPEMLDGISPPAVPPIPPAP